MIKSACACLFSFFFTRDRVFVSGRGLPLLVNVVMLYFLPIWYALNLCFCTFSSCHLSVFIVDIGEKIRTIYSADKLPSLCVGNIAF